MKGSAQRQIDLMLAPVAGRRVPGGCDDCNAYQVPEQHAPGVWAVRIFHDSTCPWYLARAGNRAQRRARRRHG